jgi:hypothetical protein
MTPLLRIIPLTLLPLLATGNAAAQAALDPAEAKSEVGFAALDRATGIAEFGFGWLTLPGAQVCVERAAGCSKGDTSFEIDAWQLIRGSRRLALGAGILLALIPTTDAPSDPAGIERDHTRRYLTIEGTLRYYPYVGERVEWWAGLTGGLVVVSDRFAVAEAGDERALLGPRGVTIRTEGGSIGVAGGPVLALTQYWTAGATFRYANWFLPDTPAVDPLGSEASLTGRNTLFSLGLNIAFRMPL